MPIQQMFYPNYSVALNAAPVLRAVGTVDSGNGAVTPGLPAGTALNDILICLVQSSNETISVPTNSVGGTWAEMTGSPIGGGTAATAGAVRLAVFWMRSPGAAAAIGTVTVADTGNHTVARIAGYTGCVTSGNPWDVTAANSFAAIAANAWATNADITTTVGNTRIIIALGNSRDSTTSPYSVSDWTATNVDEPSGNFLGVIIDNNITTGTGGGITLIDPELVGINRSIKSSIGSLSTGANGTFSGIACPSWQSLAACNWVGLTIALRSN